MNLEKRSFDLKEMSIVTRDDDSVPKISGHAAVFDTIADGYWFREKIEPGAFTDSIKKDDIRALWNHNTDFVLGRKKAKTLKLKEDDIGLKVDINPPNTQFARDMIQSIERGDISQMSIGFEVLKQSWEEEENELDLRIIRKVKLWEV